MVLRVRNIIKVDSRKARQSGAAPTTPSKRQRRDASKDGLLRRYPVGTSSLEIEDTASTEQHRKAIENELGRMRPRDSVLLPLFMSTFGERRMFIMNEASSVCQINQKYPALNRPLCVRT
jgi:hypothetical protein